jgi:hypothetical protein
MQYDVCVNLLRFILVLHVFVQSSISLLLAWSLIEDVAGSCVTSIAVSSAKVVVVVLSNDARSGGPCGTFA